MFSMKLGSCPYWSSIISQNCSRLSVSPSNKPCVSRGMNTSKLCWCNILCLTDVIFLEFLTQIALWIYLNWPGQPDKYWGIRASVRAVVGLTLRGSFKIEPFLVNLPWNFLSIDSLIPHCDWLSLTFSTATGEAFPVSCPSSLYYKPRNRTVKRNELTEVCIYFYVIL